LPDFLASGESRKLEKGAFEPRRTDFSPKALYYLRAVRFLNCYNNHRFVADPAQGHFESLSDNQLAAPRNARAILMHADNRSVDHLTALMGGSEYVYDVYDMTAHIARRQRTKRLWCTADRAHAAYWQHWLYRGPLMVGEFIALDSKAPDLGARVAGVRPNTTLVHRRLATVAFGDKADIKRQAKPAASVENDPR
jgi:hypothetical protein